MVLADIQAGEGLVVLGGNAPAPIEGATGNPFAHKIALSPVDNVAAIVEYGVPIGVWRIESVRISFTYKKGARP